MDLMNCRYLIQFAGTADSEICVNGLNNLQIGFAGKLILAIISIYSD